MYEVGKIQVMLICYIHIYRKEQTDIHDYMIHRYRHLTNVIIHDYIIYIYIYSSQM